MKLYNTLTKQIEAVTPINSGQISVYSCGPTVYDHVHIGNLSSFIFADTLRRALTVAGYKVRHVMNYTDVDDKTIRRSREQHPDVEPLEALLKLTRHFEEVFLEDMEAAGNDSSAIEFIRATDSIPAMQALIASLHKQGFAYIADDGVYFSIEAYRNSGKNYGQLSTITASSTSAARIQNDEYDKLSAHDFALWKKHKSGEPAWDFELDGQNLSGRPGWHIECSAMSKQLLGQPFDVHTGGVDLIFPHHENEIAQSTAGTDLTYAKVFAHNEHLLVDGQKMSKSLNNFYTLENIREKGYDVRDFRLLVLQAHYRKQAHFSWDNLEAARNRLEGYQAMADQYWQPRQSGGIDEAEIQQYQQAIQAALVDDIDTPSALAALSKLEAAIDTCGISISCQETYANFIDWLDSLFGLSIRSNDITDEQKRLLEKRQEARSHEDWALSDSLRGELLDQGLMVRDTDQGPIWSRRR